MNTLHVSVLPEEMALINEGLKSEIFIVSSSPKADEARKINAGDALEISDGNQVQTKEVIAINKVGPGYSRRYKKGVGVRLTEWHLRVIFTDKSNQNEDNADSKPKASRTAPTVEPAPKKV